MPATVCFDIGGVFLDWDPRYLYRQLFDGDDEAMERFLAEVCPQEWHAQMDRGRSIAEACEERKALYPAAAPLIDAWRDRSEDMIRGVIDGTVEVLRDLKATGATCYALSNMERENWEVRYRRYGFLQWFDGYFISGCEGVIKPEPEFFRRAAQRLGFRPADVVFIDDRPVNVEAARAGGLPSVLFTGPEELRRELAVLGLLPEG